MKASLVFGYGGIPLHEFSVASAVIACIHKRGEDTTGVSPWSFIFA
jgi:hypothetical protein